MKPPARPLDIVIFGLSITSSWGNGHATTYRALVRALHARGHRVRFFERDRPWYAMNRDLPQPPGCQTILYGSIAELESRFGATIDADLTILGSYVPEGARLAEWALARAKDVTAFYDIDTPVTLSRLQRGDCEYLTEALVPRFDLYLSFAGGPILERLRREYGAQRPRAFYCSVDPELYFPHALPRRYDLAYLGTYSADRQPKLDRLLVAAARAWGEGRFCVAGAQFPDSIEWPRNVERIEHVSPRAHAAFYSSQRFALNLTRADMAANGFAPSVRLFEAAACGVPIISDEWGGLSQFFVPGEEILIADNTGDTLQYLLELDPAEAQNIARRARARVLREHTAEHRAAQLESFVREVRSTHEPIARDATTGRLSCHGL